MKNIFHKMNFRKPALAGFLLLTFLLTANAYSQTGWYLSSSAQLSGGQFLSDSYTRVFSVYGTIRYQGDDFGITASIPLVNSNGNSVSQSNGMMVQSGPSITITTQNNMNFGIGDLYSYFDYKIYSDFENDIDVYLNAQVKIPTASSMLNFGTGKTDYGGSISARKSFGSFIGFVDLGYLDIGDPDGIIYKNPFTYGIGIGKFFNYGEYSLLLYYSGYTKILDDNGAPQQISLGANYRASETIILSFIGSAGLGDLMPDYTSSIGVRIKL